MCCSRCSPRVDTVLFVFVCTVKLKSYSWVLRHVHFLFCVCLSAAWKSLPLQTFNVAFSSTAYPALTCMWMIALLLKAICTDGIWHMSKHQHLLFTIYSKPAHQQHLEVHLCGLGRITYFSYVTVLFPQPWSTLALGNGRIFFFCDNFLRVTSNVKCALHLILLSDIFQVRVLTHLTVASWIPWSVKTLGWA